MGKIEEQEIIQEVEEQLNDGATYDPPMVPFFTISNIIRRVFSYLYAWDYTTRKPVKLSCNSAGELRTVQSASAYEYNETTSGTSADTYTEITPTSAWGKVDIYATTHPLEVSRSNDGGTTWQDSFVIEPDMFRSFEATTNKLRYKNHNAGSNSVFEIVGWY